MRRPGTFAPGAAAALATCAIAGAVPGCAPRIARPDAAIASWVEAVRAEDWRAAYRLLEPGARGGMEEDEFVEWSAAHAGQLQQQADRLAAAHRDGSAEVTAWLPLDSARDSELVWRNGRWFFARDVPLIEGGDTPQETLAAFASLLRGPAVDEMLAMLSATARERYRAEMEAIAAALASGARADVTVFGDHASVVVGELTVRMRREEGLWRLDSIQQPYSYGYYY